MKLHPETQRCSELYDRMAEILKTEEDPIISASVLSLLIFDYTVRSKDPADTASAFMAILGSMLDSFNHGVGPPPTTMH
jgi:hypothetical protein